MNIPFVTVLMPMRNAAEYLYDSVGSVLNQTFSDFEFLVLDDGSTDNSVCVVQGFRDERIRVVQMEHNYVATPNKGLDMARGKYVARMDADDVMLSTRLQQQVEFLETHPEVDACGTWAQTFGDNTYQIQTPVNHDEIVDRMILSNPMIHPSVMIRQTTLQRYNLRYRAEYIYSDDFSMWLEIVENGGHLANIPKVLMHYRCSSQQVSQSKRDIQQGHANRIRVRAIDFFINQLPLSFTLNIKQIKENLLKLREKQLLSLDAYCQIMYSLAREVRKHNNNE